MKTLTAAKRPPRANSRVPWVPSRGTSQTGDDTKRHRALARSPSPDRITLMCARCAGQNPLNYPSHFPSLVLCATAGLLKLGRVALDGTKLRASASRHKAMSYDHMKKKIEQLDAEVREILAEAEAVDREEDEAFGADRRGDEVPAELARRETRIAKMREAMKAIEAEAKERAGAKEASKAERAGADQEEIAEAVEQARD